MKQTVFHSFQAKGYNYTIEETRIVAPLFTMLDNKAAKFMLREIDGKIAAGAKKITKDTELRLRCVRNRILDGSSLFGNDCAFLQQLHERCTEMRRLKW